MLVNTSSSNRASSVSLFPTLPGSISVYPCLSINLLPTAFLSSAHSESRTQPYISFSLLVLWTPLWRRCASRSPHTLLFLRNERGGRHGGGGFFWGGEGVNEDEDRHSPSLSLPPFPIISRWTIWMKMRSTFSDKPRTDNPVGAFGRSTRKGRGRQSSTPWIRTRRGSRP